MHHERTSYGRSISLSLYFVKRSSNLNPRYSKFFYSGKKKSKERKCSPDKILIVNYPECLEMPIGNRVYHKNWLNGQFRIVSLVVLLCNNIFDGTCPLSVKYENIIKGFRVITNLYSFNQWMIIDLNTPFAWQGKKQLNKNKKQKKEKRNGYIKCHTGPFLEKMVRYIYIYIYLGSISKFVVRTYVQVRGLCNAIKCSR